MRICYWGAYDRGYARNRILITGLRQAGAEVIECHATVWRTPQERLQQTTPQGVRGQIARLGLMLRYIGAYLGLTVRFFALPKPDVVMVGYPGHFDVLVARLLCWLRRTPLVYDAFLSIYETAVVDRGLWPAESLRARVLWRIERLGCRWADLTLLDTQADCDYFRASYGVGHYARVWVGAEPPTWPSETAFTVKDATVFDVVWAGTFIPLHGVEHILKAAQLLQACAPEVRWTLIGTGQTYAAMRLRAEELGLTQVVWGPEWLEREALTARLAQADLVLGVFGAFAKAQRVIPNKVYDALALGRPLLTADTPGSHEALAPDETAFLCPPGDPQALAAAVWRIRTQPDLAARVAARGRALYEARFTPRAIGELTLALLRQVADAASNATARANQ